jgi:hypothetical protein
MFGVMRQPKLRRQRRPFAAKLFGSFPNVLKQFPHWQILWGGQLVHSNVRVRQLIFIVKRSDLIQRQVVKSSGFVIRDKSGGNFETDGEFGR